MLRFIDAVVVGGWHTDNPLCCHIMASRYATAPFCEKERSLDCDGLVLCVISSSLALAGFIDPWQVQLSCEGDSRI